jgi:hypothetical protein
MKKVALVFFLVLAVAMGTAFAEQQMKVSKFVISLNFENDPVKVGKNPITVEVKETSGNSVTDAKVYIEYDMAGMKGKKAVIGEGPGVCSVGELTCIGEKYNGELDFPAPGNWIVNVKTIRSGKAYTASFKVKVVK